MAFNYNNPIQGIYIMMTSSNGNIFRVTGHFCGEFTGPRWIPAQRPVMRSLMSSLICARINGWVNNRKAGDLRRNGAHYDVIVMKSGYINYMKVTVLTICRACRYHLMAFLIARFMGPTWSSPGASRTQVGPMWATWKLLSGLLQICCKSSVYVMK